ncbi:MAG: terpene cyclase/mutase family protein [Planctomycetes bacterium]|nr:terpene cyclase/mutase family protein [Planctomycetota bacterium]
MVRFMVLLVAGLALIFGLDGISAEGTDARPASQRYPTPSTEARSEMVKKAAAFLVKGQNDNGSFGLGKEVGVTAIVLNALLVSDAAFSDPGNAVSQKALTFLLDNVQPNGRISDPGGKYDNYKTSASVVALSALGEKDYAALIQAAADAGHLSRDKLAELSRERVFSGAQKYLTSQQANESSGFERHKSVEYGGQDYGGGRMPDVSNSQFALDALYTMGLRKGHSYFTRMEVFLSRSQNLKSVNDLSDEAKFPDLKNFEVQDDGGFSYAPALSKSEVDVNERGKKIAKSYASMTAAGLKCLLQIGAGPEDTRVKGALGWLARHYTLETNEGLDTPGKPEKGYQALYYYYWTLARALALLGRPTLKLADGTEIEWAGELAGKLKSLQRGDGSWKNEQSRWEESDPYLVTGYCLVALHHCEQQLRRQSEPKKE